MIYLLILRIYTQFLIRNQVHLSTECDPRRRLRVLKLEPIEHIESSRRLWWVQHPLLFNIEGFKTGLWISGFAPEHEFTPGEIFHRGFHMKHVVRRIKWVYEQTFNQGIAFFEHATSASSTRRNDRPRHHRQGHDW